MYTKGNNAGHRILESLYKGQVTSDFCGHLTSMGVQSGRVAQLVEQVTFNHWVTGSNPVPLTTFFIAQYN